MREFGFASAAKGEELVFGSERPGYPKRDHVPTGEVEEWIRFVKEKGISRVCCLLPEGQLAYYDSDLLAEYRRIFGAGNVLHAPVTDYCFITDDVLTSKVLPFVGESARLRRKVVVHCSGGIGRTGHVLACWLVYGRGYSPEQALAEVAANGRDPREAVKAGRCGASEADLDRLLKISLALRQSQDPNPPTARG